MTALKDYTSVDGRLWTGAQREAGLVAMRLAIRRAEMPEYPDHCSWCGQHEGFMNWHNEDYSRPVELLIPLCFRCHMIVHSRRWARQASEFYLSRVIEGWRWPAIERQGAYTKGFNTLAVENLIVRGSAPIAEHLEKTLDFAMRHKAMVPGFPVGENPLLKAEVPNETNG